MPKIVDQELSEYNQQSFIGGMNLLLEDTHLATNQYRIGFNVRNRYDRLDLILSSAKDNLVPKTSSGQKGIVQEMLTLGDYEIIFVSGKAYYKKYSTKDWTPLSGFLMSTTASRYWTCVVPVAETNYLRISSLSSRSSVDDPNPISDSSFPISTLNISGAAQGNAPGILVQDNINQPQFIFISIYGYPACRITQPYSDWYIQFTTSDNTVVYGGGSGDHREYVPIGNSMAWVDGILYIASQDKSMIYRSVSGRPLDFVVNVSCLLATTLTTITLSNSTTVTGFIQQPGGDAATTSYSVGVGDITCLKPQSDGSLFVSAGNSAFSVSKNMTQDAPKMFGEYTFIRKFLFNANCLSDRTIIDTTGDTRFIDLTGIRSFNSISQNQNEGRNSVFSSTIQSVFTITDKTTSIVNNIIQNANYAAAAYYNNYEFYAVTTIFGPAILVYDTINSCWVSIDINQTNGERIKKLVKIELDVLALYAITEDNNVYQLYCGPGVDTATFRTVGLSANILYFGMSVKMANPKMEIQPRDIRVVLNNITNDCTCTLTPYVNNRMAAKPINKDIKYVAPPNPTSGILTLYDVDTMLKNLYYSIPNCAQGSKMFAVISWNGGSITQFSAELSDLSPMSPLRSQ